MKAALLRRDVLLKTITQCGRFRVTAATTTGILRETLVRHSIPPRHASTQLLGHTITLTNLLASFLESEERVSVEVGAYCGTPVCESLALGETRAFVNQPLIDGPDYMRVRRIMYGKTSPVDSVTLPPGGVHEFSLRAHAEHFFAQSEGIPSAVFLHSDVSPDEDDPAIAVRSSCGVLVQPLALDMEKENRSVPEIEILRGAFSRLDFSIRALPAANLCEGESSEAFLAVEDARVFAKRASEGYAVHDLMGLSTGHWGGAAALCELSRIAVPEYEARDRFRYPSGDVSVAGMCVDAPKYVTVGMGGETQTLANSIPASSRVASNFNLPLEPAPQTIMRTPLDFHCRCSKSGVLAGLRSLGKEEIRRRVSNNKLNVAEKGGMPCRCQYCGKETIVHADDWSNLLDSIQ